MTPRLASGMCGCRSLANAAADAGRDPDDVKICVAAPANVGSDLEHQREQCRWFGAMVGNHVADIVARYGTEESGASVGVPRALTAYIARGYDYNEHGRAGNTHAGFVPDDIVDQFAIYLQHDGQEHTLAEYGNTVMRAINVTVAAIA
jgi:hypothetical protein